MLDHCYANPCSRLCCGSGMVCCGAGAPAACAASRHHPRRRARQATVRAVKLTEPLRIDGRLDEAVYASHPADHRLHPDGAAERRAGDRATEAWVIFDAENIYVVGPLLGSAPPEQVDRQRDAARHQPDAPERHFGVHARHVPRSPQRLRVLRQPARRPRSIRAMTDEGNSNADWNPVWDVRPAGSTAAGRSRWRFRSSRFATRSGTDQDWGIHMRRAIRRKNEIGAPDAAPAVWAGRGGSSASRPPRRWSASSCRRPASNVELKPYAISRVTPTRLVDAGRRQRRRAATSASTPSTASPRT